MGLSDISVIPQMPCHGSRWGDDPVPEGLVGATILRFGTPDCGEDDRRPGGGGLVIDYLSPGSTDPKRLVLGFSELGMWVEYQGPITE